MGTHQRATIVGCGENRSPGDGRFSRRRGVSSHSRFAGEEALAASRPVVAKTGLPPLKAALAWLDVAAITGDSTLNDAYLEMLNAALTTHANYLPGAVGRHEIMDRLHPYCYFLEGLTPFLEREDCAGVYLQGILSVSGYL